MWYARCMAYETLLSEDHGAVRVLTMNRPERRNAWTPQFGQDLRDAFDAASADDDVRVVVIRGAGGHYSAGADMKVFADAAAGKAQGDPRLLGRIHEPLDAFPKPLIAAVQGLCVGMAVTTLPFFDMVYAAEGATFSTPFVRIGLSIEMGASYTFPRLIGRQRANELVMRGEPIDARTACDWGLATRVFPDETFMDEVLAIAADVAKGAPGSVAHSKRLLREGLEPGLDDAVKREIEVLAERFASKEHHDAIRAFFSRKR